MYKTVLEESVVHWPMQLVGRSDDVLWSVLSVYGASREQIAYMRRLRLVSREFQLLIDDLLQSTSWLQPLATRGEVFRREYVMPDTQNWPVLLEAMRELNSDEKTLQCIIATYKLQLTLSQHRDEDPDHPIFAHRVRLTQLVAWVEEKRRRATPV